MKRIAIVGVVLVAAGFGAWGLTRSKSTPPVQFVTQPVSRGDVSSRVTATGTLSALVTVQVGTQVSGRIDSLKADFNSRVRKGDVLATLDPQLFNAALAQAAANERAALAGVTKAKAQALDAQRQLARSKELSSKDFIAKAELDTAQSTYEVAVASIESAEAAVAQARAQRQQAQVNLANATITSPIDGTIISRAVDVGQTVAASLSSPTLFTIAENLTRMQVDTSVAEADVGKLKEGTEASFSVDAFPGRRFKGTVRQIRYAATVVSNVVTYDAVIDVENPELVLRPGMTANVTFVTGEARDVVRVPNAALRFKLDDAARAAKSEPGKRTITVMRAGKPESVSVVTGLTDGSFTEVVSGLQGDEVVVTDRSGGAPGGAAPTGAAGGQRRAGGQGGMGRIL
ncbi:MAG: efflux RND transporter periplasmic adaptor subunit [Archangium sp.]|nr:efflux RND transporter periplasmic adaptor subunit [Archangium sp.]